MGLRWEAGTIPTLIDYQAAIDRYYAEWDKQDICDGDEDRDWLKKCFDEAPEIDPVHAAGGCYCRECKKCDGFPGPDIEPGEVGICAITNLVVKPDGWCRWSKQREAKDV